MFRFTIRELFAVLGIAGVACIVAQFVGPADPITILMISAILILFGCASFSLGVWMGRRSAAGTP